MKTKIEYNGIFFDSTEELLFYYYLEELKESKYVKHFEYNTKSFILSEPVKYIWIEKKKNKEVERESILLHGHIYTPDFFIEWDKKSDGIFYKSLYSKTKLTNIPFITINVNESYIEIKPIFDFKNMTRISIINQKWMFKEKQIYVQKIIPTNLFSNTFTPQKALYTEKTKKLKKYKFKIKTLSDFLQIQKIQRNNYNEKK